jgi:hypothetical protein
LTAVADRDDLMRRRGELIVRSRQLRADWGRQAQALRAPLGMADSARAGTQWLLRNPQWPLGVLAVVMLVQPRRVLRLAGRLWWGYAAYRRVRRIFGPPRL